MDNVEERLPEINALEAEAFRAAQAGREDDALRLWNRILELDPRHARTLTALGQRSFRSGDMASARVAFQVLPEQDPGVVYVAAAVAASRSPLAVEYVRWLRSSEFQQAAAQLGFKTVSP